MQFPPDLGLSPDGVLGVVPVQGFTRFLALPDAFIVQVQVVNLISLVHVGYGFVHSLNDLPLVVKPWRGFPGWDRVRNIQRIWDCTR